MKKRSRIHPFEFSRRFVWLVFRFCLILPIGWFSTAQTLPVERITIKSAWEGLSPSPPPPVELVIRRQSDGFYSNGEKINSGLVEALVNTFRQPPVANPKASNLGITQAWLNESVDLAGSKSFRYQLVLRAHVDAYRSFFMNLANVQKLLPSLFAGFHTDDYPHVEVQVVFVGGEIWLASSDSQYEFMILWKVRARNPDFTTYNADLSQRIAALMPDKSVNRERLSGESFKLRLAEAVMARIEADWLNPAITTLQTEYNVQRSEITSNSSVNYGREWKDGHPEERIVCVEAGLVTEALSRLALPAVPQRKGVWSQRILTNSGQV
jgi:hypothetical protein